MSFHRSPTGPAPAEPARRPGAGIVRAEIASRRLGRWPVAGPLLHPRLVASSRASPLARPAPVADPANSLLALDLGLDLDTSTVRIDRSLLEAWGIAPHLLWETALANVSSRPDPPRAVLAHLPRVWICTDGPWTTGWTLLPHRMNCPRVRSPASAHPQAGSATTPLIALAPAPDLLILTAADPSCGRRPAGVGLEPLFRLAGLVAGQHPDRLPLELLAPGPFPGAFPPAVGLE